MTGVQTYALPISHLDSAPYVRTGQLVTRGQLIGRVGRTGNAAHACPHLHLSFKIDRRPQNPIAALRLAEAQVGPTVAPDGTQEAAQ